MLISVVTPNFNMASYLGPTIESVLRNLVPGDEYFVIDGGSRDDSVEVIRKYEDRITGWISERDEGYADAIAKGFDRATGDILCWINAGDLFLDGALEAARTQMTDNRDLIFGDDFYIDEQSRVLAFSRGWVPNLKLAMLYGGWTPLQDACFWRRSLYQRIGGLDRQLRHAADYDLFLRMALAGRANYVPITFSAFRRHAGQKSIAQSNEYAAERRSVRQRALRALHKDHAHDALWQLPYRLAVSVRARLGLRIWRRPDLAGTEIADLPSRSYWPV